MKLILYILFSFFITGILLAGNSSASICDKKEAVVFFGNGVTTIERKAFDSRDIIKEELKAKLTPEEFEVLDFKLAYNDTHGLPLDLLESSVQLLSGNISRFWSFFWNLIPAPEWFTEKIVLLSVALDNSALLTTDSLGDHLVLYRAKIAEGKKVILVAHSQGNLFGNLAYSLLKTNEQQSFGMVSVANTDNNVLGGSVPYTTLDNDKVILALIAAQIALPTRPMSPNTENLNEPGDSLGHSFIQSYMENGSKSSDQITNDIIAMLGTLPEPSQTDKPGIITVRLTWENEPDMDLHVIEPNGMHVYYENAYGYSGTLDRDDRTAPGTEHYTVPTCDTLEKGVYRIGLDYFKGDGPEIGKVLVNAGILSRTFEEPMSWEYYGDPDHPEIIAHISVREGENGGFEFNIYPNN